MNRKNKIKAIVALAVALAFVMPGAAAFANVGTFGITSNSENTDDIENIVEISTNSDTSDTTLALPVHNLDTGLDYATIQEAIDAVQTLDGHTIYVDNGTYYEYLTVDKSINLVGQSKEGTIMDGSGGTEKILLVIVDNVNVSSFTFRNGNYGPYFNPSNYSSITNCIGNNIKYGFYFRKGVYNCISDCISYGNVNYGIYIRGDSTSDYNTVTNCTCYTNLHGIYIKESGDNIITNNTCHNNSNYGIYSDYRPSTAGPNKIYHNNFVDNTVNDACANLVGPSYFDTWDNGYPSGGNYYSEYSGVDNNHGPGQDISGSDGIGDTAYEIPGGGTDNYPFMNQITPPAPPGEINYTLDITPDPFAGGTVDASPGPEEPNWYAEDTVVTLTANANPGWTFSHWSGNLTGSTNPDNITMDSNKSVTATFTKDQYTLTINIVGNGSVAKDPSQSTYTYGTLVNLNATADPGWTFDHWSGDLSGSLNPETINMTSDKTVNATFTEDQYTLTINIVGNGSVDVDPAGLYKYDTVVTLTANATTGWSFAGWSGPDGGLVDGNNKIIMTKNMEVTATFTKGWESLMNFTGDLLGADTVVFGEKGDASDGIDTMDVPKPPSPGAPYIYAYIEHDLPGTSHDILWEEYRLYNASNDLQIWDLFVETDTTGGSGHETVEVNITWDKDVLATETQYEHIDLYDVLSGDLLEDMTTVETYEFTADSGMANHFQIICSDNHDPVAVPESYETMEAHKLIVAAPGVLLNDFDVDGDLLTVVVPPETDVSNGTLTLYTDGSFEYMPDLGFSGIDSFTYKANDGALDSNIVTVTIEVLQLNHIEVQDGWNLISMPVGESIDKTDILVRYLDDDYTWTKAVAANITADPTFGWNSGMYTVESILIPGDAYWMWSYQDCELLIPSNAEADNHITNLAVAWNLVGIPYDTPLLKTNISIYYNGDLYTWDEATTDNNPTGEPIILGFVFGWNRASQNYVVLTDTDPFMPGYGYWMYAFHGCALKKA